MIHSLTANIDLEKDGLKRRLRRVESSQGARIIFQGRDVLNFCSNNYLGLANDVRLVNAAKECLDQYGIGSGASRLVCGNMNAHEELEKRVAQFKGTQKCLVYSTGYMANVGIIASLFGRNDFIFSDRLNHASIVDGIKLSGSKFKRYAHCDLFALEGMLKNNICSGKRVIITDSVFSMDGDVAPLVAIVALAKKYNCYMIVDEAHAFGVFGKKGKGLVEQLGLENDIDIQMGTFSKAAGSFGAYCCGSKELIDFLIQQSRSFIYTTALPPSVCAASLVACEIIEQDQGLRALLWKNTTHVLSRLKDAGFNTLNSQSPIIPIIVADNHLAVDFSQKLLDKRILVSAIRPPTVPVKTARLRLTITASHTQHEIDCLIEQVIRIGKELCLI